ncbi:PAS domain-containing protein [Massilia oculi]|uniref:PAS domain-containing protein n=1 Tax=Massilia oculi TaxID=945844 RepID=UPI0028A70E10|nr:PAS domain-containing protein [Massilia oculi]
MNREKPAPPDTRLAAQEARDRDRPRQALPAPGVRRERLSAFAGIHRDRRAALGAPSILLDANAEIVHISPCAAHYLRHPGGEPTRELAALLPPPLQLPLRAALCQTHENGQASTTGPLRHMRDGQVRLVEIRVLPFEDPGVEGTLVLVQFVELEQHQPAAGAPDQDGAVLRQLDGELRHLRRQLNDTVEQAQRSDDQMRMQCEEMQSISEQLRATVAELEGKLDDLRYRNQALALDKLALQRRIEEADKARDDLSNLIASSGVATIFIDRAMCIQRFTPRIADFFNVLPSDVGRPLPHIANRLDYPQLAEEAARVFDTLQPMEREVRATDGRDYIVRVHPYRTTSDRIEGAVMTFFDITSWRAAENALRESEARLSAVFDSLPVGVAVFDTGGMVTMSNPEMTRYLPTGILPSRDAARVGRWHGIGADGHPVAPHDFPGARARRGERVVPGIEMIYIQDDGRATWTRVSSVPIRNAHGDPAGHIGVVTDIDALKRSEAVLQENEVRLRTLLDGLAQQVWESDGAHPPPGWLDAIHPDDRDATLRRWQAALARREVFEARFRIRAADGGWRLAGMRAAPLFNVDGNIHKWVAIDIDADRSITRRKE